MKKAILIKAKFLNFKGIRNLEIDFNEDITDIYGDNGVGKTTIVDGIEWLRSGKDSYGSANFEIKTLDNNNIPIPQIEHEVEAIYMVDGEEVKLRRVLVEKWQKTKGNEFPEFKGNETKYYWNDVPKSMAEYNSIVSNMIVENLFRLITNPLAFNNDKILPWEKRRGILTDMAQEKTFEELAGENPEYLNLLSKLTGGKTLDEYKKQIAASITKSKEDLKAIPTRIDEADKGKPEQFNFDALELELSGKKKELESLEKSLLNKSSQYDDVIKANGEIRVKINTLEHEISTIENSIKSSITASKNNNIDELPILNEKLAAKQLDLKYFEDGINTVKSRINTKESELSEAEKSITIKRNLWVAENSKEFVFDESNCDCPTCKRPFEKSEVESKREEMKVNFINDKKNLLNSITAAANNLNSEKANLQKEIDSLNEKLAKGTEQRGDILRNIESIQLEIKNKLKAAPKTESVDYDKLIVEALLTNVEYQSKITEKELLKTQIKEVIVADESELINQKIAIQSEIEGIQKNLNNKSIIENIDSRIKALKEEEKRLSAFIMSVEKEQFVIEKFNKLRIESIENEVNKKFSLVKFKMFDTQVNNGESECCKAMINGVPFSDLNTASKINAGLDIINTLCEFYQVSAPIFIDNRESIVQTIPVNSQLINLNVLEGALLSIGKPVYTKEYLTLNPHLKK